MIGSYAEYEVTGPATAEIRDGGLVVTAHDHETKARVVLHKQGGICRICEFRFVLDLSFREPIAKDTPNNHTDLKIVIVGGREASIFDAWWTTWTWLDDGYTQAQVMMRGVGEATLAPYEPPEPTQ